MRTPVKTYRGYRIERIADDHYRAVNERSNVTLSTGVTVEQVQRAVDTFLAYSEGTSE